MAQVIHSTSFNNDCFALSTTHYFCKQSIYCYICDYIANFTYLSHNKVK